MTLPLHVSTQDGLPSPEPEALPTLLETLLFVSPSPVTIARLAQTAGVASSEIETALSILGDQLQEHRRGVRLQRQGDRVSLTSAPEHASYIERLLGLDLSSRLSNAAMETLAVIAYRQPLTRPQIEAIRGVNCDGVLKTLITRELIESVGRLEQPGRPFLYGTTFQFLQYFGLTSLADLPPLPDPGT